jgi:hypothetical protein
MNYLLCFLFYFLAYNICASDLVHPNPKIVFLPKEFSLLCSMIEGSQLDSGKFEITKIHLSKNLEDLDLYEHGAWYARVRDNGGFSVKEQGNEIIVVPPFPKKCSNNFLILSDRVRNSRTFFFAGLCRQGCQYSIDPNLTLHLGLQIEKKEHEALSPRGHHNDASWESTIHKFFGKFFCAPIG